MIEMEKAEALRETMRRCRPEAVEAAIVYHETGDSGQVPIVVMGVIERFLEPEFRPKIHSGDESLRLAEDLGIDSLIMVEIIIMIEETLGISINNEEIKDVRTLGDLKAYLDGKLKAS